MDDDAELTYREVGASRDDVLPDGFHHLEASRVVGHGESDLRAAAERLMTWQMHRSAGFGVDGAARAEEGAVVRLALARGLIVAPVRVVYVVDEPRRQGFGYGTLPGHPECGEESFVLSLTEDDAVRFDIRAFSRPGNALTRLGGPIARAAQHVITRRYLDGVGAPPGRSRGPW